MTTVDSILVRALTRDEAASVRSEMQPQHERVAKRHKGSEVSLVAGWWIAPTLALGAALWVAGFYALLSLFP